MRSRAIPPYTLYLARAGIVCMRNGPFQFGRVIPVEYIRLGIHIWVSVLIMGTLWRLLQYHLVASSNQTWQHLGRAMALQY